MHDFKRIHAAVIRGGTSKGVYLHADALPDNPAVRDRIILSIFGSPDPRQIDGLGGADPLTSKVAIIGPSKRADADVDYTFGYVGIDSAVVDYEGNCGNISLGVGPFAVDEGMIPVTEPITRVRIFNTNTSKIIEAEVPVTEARASTEGDFVLHGVPGTGARIVINFVDCGGSRTGRLLPTGNVSDRMHLRNRGTIRVSLVDAANPAVFVQAKDVGFTGNELPGETSANKAILDIMEEIRVKAALMMKLATSEEQVSPAVPKVVLVAPPQDYATITGAIITETEHDLLARTKALKVMHKTFAVTGGICLSTAALIEGTVVYETMAQHAKKTGVVRVGHPSGVSSFLVEVTRTAVNEFKLTRAGVVGTSRRIMDGYAYVPNRIFLAGRKDL